MTYLIEQSYSQAFVLVDENTRAHCLPLLKKHLLDYELIEVPSGEQNKQLASAEKVWSKLTSKAADRKSVLINLGGGVITDMGGFCAAAFKRGIDYVNIPTSLLAMVDAAIGGKVAIDHESYKNQIGFFKHPKAIFIYPDFIKTQSKRLLRSGFAEIVKHALITDLPYWEKINEINPDNLSDLQELINRSVKIKMKITNKDPKERGGRKLLNFGHTIGHALESWSLVHDKDPVAHGEAVAAGMVCEAYCAHKISGLSKKDLKSISGFITKVFPQLSIDKISFDELMKYLKQDKKNEDDGLRPTLLKYIGKGVSEVSIEPALIKESLQYYQELS